jgi:hypothetical protein
MVMSQGKYRSLVERLEVYRESHPYLVAIWRDYIRIKEERFRDAIRDCEGVLQKLDDTEDIDMLTIATIIAVLHTNPGS